jgi:hypothetical protein
VSRVVGNTIKSCRASENHVEPSFQVTLHAMEVFCMSKRSCQPSLYEAHYYIRVERNAEYTGACQTNPVPRISANMLVPLS